MLATHAKEKSRRDRGQRQPSPVNGRRKNGPRERQSGCVCFEHSLDVPFPIKLVEAVVDFDGCAARKTTRSSASLRTRSCANGMMRSLEIAARRCGIEILLEHRMVRIYREAPNAGRSRRRLGRRSAPRRSDCAVSALREGSGPAGIGASRPFPWASAKVA
jgi:hypothetical protein